MRAGRDRPCDTGRIARALPGAAGLSDRRSRSHRHCIDGRRHGRADLTGSDALNSAIFFPWVRAPDPLQQNALADFPPCGFVAGVFARTDSTRGVWKAPAGTDAAQRRARPGDQMSDAENGQLNPLGDQLPAHLPDLRQRGLGLAHAARPQRPRLRMEIRAGAADGAVPRGEPLPRHPMGRVRAQ